MNRVKRQLVGSIAIASLLCAEALLATSVHATTPPQTPILISQLQRWKQTYQCGNFAITLSEEARDRYTYEAVNAKGQKITITDGTHNGGRNYSSIYTFNKDGSQYVLEDFGGGKAALTIGNYPSPGATYDCTTDGNP